MSTADLDRATLRRAALRAALRRGDVVGATRAWERLRVDGAGLRREEVLAARDARRAVGRAIRDARLRRAHADARAMPARAAAVPLVGGALLRLRRAASTAALYVLVFALFLVIYPPRPEVIAPAAAAPQVQSEAQPEPTPVPASGRGRTSATLAPVVVLPTAPPPTTAQPTAAPTTVASAATPRTGTPTGSPSAGGVPSGVAGGAPGGVTGGTPGGVVGGVPAATSSPRATPAPTPSVNVLPLYPTPLAAGSDRFLFRVVDARTGSSLPNVCVIYGTHTCGPSDPHTNSLGYFWLDLVGRVATNWSFRFDLDGYVGVSVNKTYRTGQGTVVTTVDLRRR